MKSLMTIHAPAAVLLLAVVVAHSASAQKPGGILKLYSWDSPPSVSPLDGPNPIGQRVTAPVFNNLGFGYLEAGNLDRAGEAIDEAIRRDDKLQAARFNRAVWALRPKRLINPMQAQVTAKAMTARAAGS